MAALHWHIYCRVIDNLGDAGVCWRLACNLALRGQRVRLVIDDPAPLAFMAPHGAEGVEVQTWPGTADGPGDVGDVVVEAFGCDPPEAVVQAMLRRQPAPVWINLEYLSAEAYVERSHRLPSPQRNGLMKWFFYPGFTPATGGLLREPGLVEARQAFDAAAWRAAHGIHVQPGERAVSLFCYDNAPLDVLPAFLARQPTLLLLTPGPAQRLSATPPGVRVHRLPWLSQADFDHLLWSCELNFVRGEDSLVRALWAGAPFVWQAYPQHDGAHAPKIEALMARLQLPDDVAVLWRHWNGLTRPSAALPDAADPQAWARIAAAARAELLGQADLATQLLAFVATRHRLLPHC